MTAIFNLRSSLWLDHKESKLAISHFFLMTESLTLHYRQQVSEMTGVAAEEITLIHGLTVLAGDSTLEALGLEEESTINMVLSLCGGKKKRKKKVYTKPKRIAHKHKKRPKAILEYFNVDNTGKIVKLKIECEKCPPGKSRSL
jgi:ubiquitin-small subunit ribosomal protein S27Ae